MEQCGSESSGEHEDADQFLLWALVWSELVIFGIMLGAFYVVGWINPQRFVLARLHLLPWLAAFNTIVLLTSGWQAALAARRSAPLPQRRRALVFAALLGLVFAIVKFIEYGREIASSNEAALQPFFELYFLITGFHLVHVVFGAGVLLLVAWRPSDGNIGLGTTLWHLIDMIWIVIFPLVYLV